MSTLGEVVSKINVELEKFNGAMLNKDNTVDYFNEISDFIVNYFKENTNMKPYGGNRNIFYSESEPIPFATICYNYKPNQEGKEITSIYLGYETSFETLEIDNIPMASYYDFKLSQLKSLEREILLLTEDKMDIEDRIIQKEFLYKQLEESLRGYIY